MKRWIGVDIGKSGAMVSLDESGNVEVIPFDEESYRDALDRWKDDSVTAACENVHSMPKQGVSSSFTFGQNFGWILGLFYAYRISVNLVSPMAWKKHFGVQLGKNASKAEKKSKTISVMKQLFPSVSLKRTERSKVDDDNIADALALAEFCRRNC